MLIIRKELTAWKIRWVELYFRLIKVTLYNNYMERKRKLMKHTFYGLLTYNDNGEYEVGEFNISDILYNIYYNTKAYSELPVVKIKIQDENRTLLNEEGELYIARNEFGVYSFFVNDRDIEGVLFEATDKTIDIVINLEESNNANNQNSRS